jgi:hypothetical protein
MMLSRTLSGTGAAAEVWRATPDALRCADGDENLAKARTLLHRKLRNAVRLALAATAVCILMLATRSALAQAASGFRTDVRVAVDPTTSPPTYLVVWSDSRDVSSGGVSQIWGALVRGNGANGNLLLGGNIKLSNETGGTNPATGGATLPAVASLPGVGFAVVWDAAYPSPPTHVEIHATIVQENGSLQPLSVPVVQAQDSLTVTRQPEIACGSNPVPFARGCVIAFDAGDGTIKLKEFYTGLTPIGGVPPYARYSTSPILV